MSTPDVAQRDRWILVAIGVAVVVGVVVTVCRPWDLQNGLMIGAPVGRDFANFWLGGRLALDGNFPLLIDVAGYNELFSRTFDHNPAESFIYSYPPHSLLFVAPFAALPFTPAVYLWTALNLFGIERAVRLLGGNASLAVTACLSPAVLTMVVFGHFGGALAWLAVYALLRAETRPMLASVCLALISVKPQLALVLGIILILTGRWRAVAWSVPATLSIVALSVAAFGIEPWRNFVTWIVPFHARLVADFSIEGLRTVISVYAGARLSGLPGLPAQLLQYAFSLVVLARAVILFRRQGANARTVTLAVLAGLAALPYFNSYDLAIAAPALTLALFDREEAPLLPFVPAVVLWLLPIFSIPVGLLEIPAIPLLFNAVLLLALFGSAWRSAGLVGSPAAPPAAAR